MPPSIAGHPKPFPSLRTTSLARLAGAAVMVLAVVQAAENLPQQKENRMTQKKLLKTEEEWKRTLTPEQFQIMRKKGTEPPFTGAYANNHEKGVYVCPACGTPLFGSETKFDSGTGWPSFWAPISPEAVGSEEDKSLFMRRTEVHCTVCG